LTYAPTDTHQTHTRAPTTDVHPTSHATPIATTACLCVCAHRLLIRCHSRPDFSAGLNFIQMRERLGELAGMADEAQVRVLAQHVPVLRVSIPLSVLRESIRLLGLTPVLYVADILQRFYLHQSRTPPQPQIPSRDEF
jgi:hypothetical protein